MTKSKEEIIADLESDNIEDVIAGLDVLKEQVSILLNKSLGSLKKNKEWRSFIAERIYAIIHSPRIEMQAFFNQEKEDDDFRFWLSTLLLEYDKNSYANILVDYVENHEDGKEMLAINILIKKRVPGLDKIIINKLRKIEFNGGSFDLINFYLDNLKGLAIIPPTDILQKIDNYNKDTKFDWQKLIY